MATDGVLKVCPRCGEQDRGTYCSSCGSNMDLRNPTLRAVKTFTGPLWDYATLSKDVVQTKSLIGKVKTGQVDLISVLAFGVTAAAISGILQYVFKVPPLIADGIPVVSDAEACLVVVLIAAVYITPQHFLLRRRNREIRYVWALTMMSCAIAVLYPLFVLSGIGSDKQTASNADPTFLQGVVAIAFVILFFRIGALLYCVKVKTVLWANVMMNVILIGPVVVLMLLISGTSGLRGH